MPGTRAKGSANTGGVEGEPYGKEIHKRQGPTVCH